MPATTCLQLLTAIERGQDVKGGEQNGVLPPGGELDVLRAAVGSPNVRTNQMIRCSAAGSALRNNKMQPPRFDA